jgi:hypothetical protein
MTYSPTRLFPAITIALAALLPTATIANTIDDFHSAIEACQPTFWYKLDNTYTNAGSAGSATLTSVETSFGNDCFGNASSALDLNSLSSKAHSGSVDVISGGGPGPNAAAAAAGSLVVLFKTPALGDKDSTQRYIFRDQVGNKANSNQLGLFVTTEGAEGGGSYRLAMNFGAMNSSTIYASLVPDTWYFFALVWNEATNAGEARVFLGKAGDSKLLVKNSPRDVSNESVAGANGLFNLGNFSNANTTSGFFCPPSPGQIDEFATFNRELTPDEISSVFLALTP